MLARSDEAVLTVADRVPGILADVLPPHGLC
jgi:hypothetical protein